MEKSELSKYRTLVINVLIAAVAALLFVPGLGSVELFDWDEINFAESAREMIVTGDYLNVQVNFQSFWEKPPLFTWLQVLSMKAFGINEFAARFPNAIVGIITLLLLFNIGRKNYSERFGFLWMGMYLVSFLSFFYFKSGIIDPWFNLFIFMGIYFMAKYSTTDENGKNKMLYAVISGASIGLGVMTKGPVALLVFGLTFVIWLLFNKFRLNFRWKDVIVWVLVFCVVGGSWFVVLALTGHTYIIMEFIDYQIRLFQIEDAGHGGFPLYHFVILLFGMMPASILALPSFGLRITENSETKKKALTLNIIQKEKSESFRTIFTWMLISFWVVLILFSIVNTKIIHYSSFCYFPLTFLAAFAVEKMLSGELKLRRYQSVLLIVIASLWGIILTVLTIFDKIKEYIYPYVNDSFAIDCMSATSEWVGFEPLVGIILILCTIVFCVLFRKKQNIARLCILGAGNLLFVFTFMLMVVGEIEKYSQASAVEFFESKKGEDCYIKTFGYYSYAHYFYSDRQPENRCDDESFLLHGDLDKPCYFSVKNYPDDIENFKSKAEDADFLYSKTGFSFFVRMPKQ